MRYLIAVLMMGLLAACDLGAATPSEQPLPSVGDSVEESMDAHESDGADASDDMTAMTCEEAWDAVPVDDVSSIDDLEAIGDELERTVEACDSLDAWLDEAASMMPAIDEGSARAWAAARCSENDTLSESPVCVEISG